MASIKIIQRTKEYKNGERPIFLIIIKDRKQKQIALGYSCDEKQWNKTKAEFKKGVENYKQRNLILHEAKSRALKILDEFRTEGKDFTLLEFEEKFRGIKRSQQKSIREFGADKIADLRKEKKIGNAFVYDETLKSFLKFMGDDTVVFADMTPQKLNKYETDLRSRGGTDGGISVKMRTLRSLFNYAVTAGAAKKENYPFDAYKIAKLKSKTQKRALTREQVRMIENCPVNEHPKLTDARNYFVFSYYTRGMNFVDMMLPKWSDIVGDRVYYKRAKTGGNFSVKIHEAVKPIIEYYKQQDNLTSYIFPILLSDNLAPNQIDNRKKKVLSQYNKALKEIAKLLGIGDDLTSCTARHSYATNMKHAGASIAVISESMGHKNTEIAEVYLKQFDNKVIDEAVDAFL